MEGADMPSSMLDKMALLTEVKSRLTPIYGDRLKGVVLFGSEAYGTSTPDSDVDILVLLDGNVNYGRDLLDNINALHPLSSRLGRRFSPKPVSLNEYENLQCPLYLDAHVEGIRL